MDKLAYVYLVLILVLFSNLAQAVQTPDRVNQELLEKKDAWNISFSLQTKHLANKNPSDRFTPQTSLEFSYDPKLEKRTALGTLSQYLTFFKAQNNLFHSSLGAYVDLGVTLKLVGETMAFWHLDVKTLDGKFGLLTDVQYDFLNLRLSLNHWSAHLVDGSNSSDITERTAISYSLEDVRADLVLSPISSVKLFSNIASVFHMTGEDMKRQKKSFLIYGAGFNLMAFSSHDGLIRPFLSGDIQFDGKVNYQTHKTVICGFEWGKLKGNSPKIGFQFREGFRREGLYYDKPIREYGIVFLLPYL